METRSGSYETISTVSEVHSQVSSPSATSSELSLSTNPSVASSLSATSQSTVSSTASTSSAPEAHTRVATSPVGATSATIAASEPLVTKEPVTKMVTGKPLYLQYNGPIASNEKIQYAVWGESEGRNDLTWYSENVAGAAYIDLSKHKEYGLYHVHTYKNVSGKMIGIEGGSITISKPWVTPIVKKIASDHYVVRLEQVPGSLSQIKVPVWSEDQGQDDLKWYSARQVSSDVYEAHIYAANHKNSYGKYQVHVYAQSFITGKSLGIGNGSFIRENIRALSPASVAISHKTGTTATITVSGSSDSKVISRVSVAVWSQTNGQDDLKWYKAAVANQTAQLTVDMRDLSNTTDDYTIHVYTDYADGSRTGTNLGQVHFTKSNQLTKTGNVKITAVNKTTNSFQTIITNASSSEGLKSIRVAVWSDQNGQDDLEWQVATKQADGSYIATTDLAKHAYANDTYHVHVYYELANGKLSGLSGNKTNVSGVMPNLSKIASSIVGLNQFVPTTADRLALKKAIKVIKNQSYDVGFVLYDLVTKRGVSYNANKGFYVASAIKAPYVASLAANNKTAFQSYQSTIKDILYYSSNNGYNLLRRTYGGVYMEKWTREAEVNPALAAPGYPYITANEMAKLWERNNLFFQNTTTGKQMASWYERPNLSPIRSMLGSQYNTKSKAGWIGMPGYHAANGAGIVSTPKGRYVLAIMSNADGKLGLLNELVLSLNNIYKSL